MTSTEAWVLLIFTWVVTVMWVRNKTVTGWQACVIAVMGFSLACTPLGYIATSFFSTAFSLI